MVLKVVLIGILSIAVLCNATAIEVQIVASWQDTPLLAEASEAVAALRSSGFWTFVDLVGPIPESIRQQLVAEGENPQSPNITSPQIEQYAKALSLIPGILFSAGQQKLARAELAARAFSPKIRAHHDAALAAINASGNRENPECLADAFVEVARGKTVCSAETLDKILSESGFLEAPGDCRDARPRFEQEHDFPRTAVNGACLPHVVLYGALGTSRTAALVKAVKAAVQAGRVTATFRHYIVKTANLEQPVHVQGYGVTVDVKNMEYKAVDEKSTTEESVPSVDGIDIQKLIARYPSLTVNLTKFARKASVSGGANLDLKVWEVQKLGYQAAHVILSDKDPMAAFLDITENFPARVGKISQLEASPEFDSTLKAVEYLQAMYGEGQSRLWLDGRVIEPRKQDFFAMLSAIRNEEMLLNQVHLALTGNPNCMKDFEADVKSVVSCPVTSPRDAEKPRLLLAEDEVVWINNIEEDEMYGNLEKRLVTILQAGHFGQPRFARRNLLNLVYVIDPTDREGVEAMSSFIRLFQQGAAIRFGVMFKFPEVNANEVSVDAEGNSIPPLAALVASALETLLARPNKADAAMFLVRALYSAAENAPLTHSSFVEAWRSFGGAQKLALSPTVSAFMANWTRKVKSLGLSVPVAVFNGVVYSDSIDEVVYRAFGPEFGRMKSLVSTKQIHEATEDLYVAIHGNFVRRYQPAIFDNPIYASWSSTEHQSVYSRATWIYSADHNYDICDISHVFSFNASTKNGLKHLGLLVKYLDSCPKDKCSKTRITVLPCDTSRSAAVITALLHHAGTLPERKRASFVAKFVAAFENAFDDADSLNNDKDVLAVANRIARDMGSPYDTFMDWAADYELSRHTAACRLVSGETNQSTLHTNGRVVVVDESFADDDFSALESIERSQLGSVMASCIQPIDFATVTEGKTTGDDLTAEFYSNKLAVVSSIVAHDLLLHGSRASAASLPQAGALHGFSVGLANESRHQLVAVVDPVSRSAQKVAAIAQYLRSALGIALQIHFNPPQRVQKVPIKNYYHFAAHSDLHFANGEIVPPKAVLKNLPTNVVLTLGIDDPDSWMVFAEVAEDDLDNLQLKPDRSVTAIYKLQSLVITGTCIDVTKSAPPRGLPIVLSDAAGIRDTLVMSNYGYFQLQGQPGVGSLYLPEGRASQFFSIESVNGVHGSAIAVDSFEGAHATVLVRRQPGFETADFLEEKAATPDAPSGIFSSLFGSSKKVAWPPERGSRAEKPNRPTLNIFSLASGHLYERFLRLMMSTVMSTSSDKFGVNTTRIKFWLIENPMSPRFKKLLPHLAKKFGFEYGLVKYKWPHWLTRQTEKQRMIWAYKVLFLDVLFPLDVEKIIFVDADQIVRSDLHELYNLDLQGRAVAYTPFCRAAARENTKGFRFWDSGYWKDHLQGKPYHISAIYVVDLLKLRQIAAGDRYRVTYDNLAQDPNSLANLDQDLPNFAQHQVPIFSLPEEWLWCETWCSDASKEKAKTIDLCNNPLTKTPKLENAKRIIPEWEAMDTDLANFEREVLS